MLPNSASYNPDRLIVLGPDCAPIPERLLLAHARGQVLFISGAGVSRPSGLPDFRDLILQTYAVLDTTMHLILSGIPVSSHNQYQIPQHMLDTLTPQQRAEVQRFIEKDYDVVLGLLERRLDNTGHSETSIRNVICDILHNRSSKPSSLHRSLMCLADRGGVRTIVTTNFDLLLEAACIRSKPKVRSLSLGSIPRPSRQPSFAGVFHIHGALERDQAVPADLVLTDHDFGEFYLRRRIIPDFIYDAARLFHIVLVGYSANDPPMRYLLNAVAADGSRFDDLKERFSFISQDGPADDRVIADWRGRGIFPIPYSSANQHAALALTFHHWAELSAHTGKTGKVDSRLRQIVRRARADTTEVERDFFDHMFRRSNTNERQRLSRLISRSGASIDWLDSIDDIGQEQG